MYGLEQDIKAFLGTPAVIAIATLIVITVLMLLCLYYRSKMNKLIDKILKDDRDAKRLIL